MPPSRPKADAVIVHHGLFWKGDSPALVGYQREACRGAAGAQDQSYAYHLPLDVRSQGWQQRLSGPRLGLSPTGTCGEKPGW